MGALKEVLAVIIVMGGPVLFVILWGQHKERQARKYESPKYIIIPPYFDWGARQKRLDDHTFKTVEEYRHELD